MFDLLLVLALLHGALGVASAPGRMLSGWLYPAQGADVGGVRVRYTLGGLRDSTEAEPAGRFSLALPRQPLPGDSLTVETVDPAGRYLPSLHRLRIDGFEGALAVVLVPRRWEIASGLHRGESIGVDLAAAARRCERCPSFYPEPSGNDSIPPRRRGVPAWPDSALPAYLAFDTTAGPRFSASDTAAFWRAARTLEEELGRDLFKHASLALAMGPPPGDPHGVLIVVADPTIDRSGIGGTGSQAGDILGASVSLRSPGLAAMSGGQTLVMHELMHALGFGHTCAWRSIVSADRCPQLRAERPTAEDVAYAQLLWSIRALERERGAVGTVGAVLAAEGGD
ncbi:MAG TPA: hypothetical protein VFL93_06490 [Longimicrobiaceae bacterium]|nr:hypothetical protein [Longimicrobiaceae bacterium]